MSIEDDDSAFHPKRQCTDDEGDYADDIGIDICYRKYLEQEFKKDFQEIGYRLKLFYNRNYDLEFELKQ